jgi:hypothetical protein
VTVALETDAQGGAAGGAGEALEAFGGLKMAGLTLGSCAECSRRKPLRRDGFCVACWARQGGTLREGARYWYEPDLRMLRTLWLVWHHYPQPERTALIGQRLKRTAGSVLAKAMALGLRG